MGIRNVNITFPQKLTKKVQIYLSHSIVKVLSKEIVAKSFHNHTFQILFCHRQKICVKVFLFCPLLWLFYIAIDTKKAWENQKSVGERNTHFRKCLFFLFFSHDWKESVFLEIRSLLGKQKVSVDCNNCITKQKCISNL